ncbi:hypothetical protein SLEP1_g25138 [Rubroshorea leprosula]|uniref:Uncharacterized protein n=1 Tax=Rubroshorea leprosula TaxID=152421 RepID=A0AAV5JP51_9ROSI|nr:hypothetical protein SLEP1_g25138 [Rubroshorea leprosula]
MRPVSRRAVLKEETSWLRPTIYDQVALTGSTKLLFDAHGCAPSGGAEENRSLLFFWCPLLAQVWRGVLAHLGYFRPPQRWEIEWQWLSGEGKREVLEAKE